MTDRRFILDNFAYRTSLTFPTSSINIGVGCNYPSVVVIHKGHTTTERDAITGALSRFNILEEAYRIPAQILDLEQIFYKDYDNKFHANRKLIFELLDILKPHLIVCAGEQAINAINTTTKKSKNLIGKTFSIKDLTSGMMCGIIDPETYSFERATSDVKERGKAEWEAISKLLKRSKG